MLEHQIDAKAIFLFGVFVEAFLEKKEATSQLFWSAEMFLGGALPRNLTSQKAGIDFVDPQVLVRGHYDLRETFLIVDEAAGFPVNFTVELLQKAGRVLLATTLDGDLFFRKFRMGSHFMGGSTRLLLSEHQCHHLKHQKNKRHHKHQHKNIEKWEVKISSNNL